MPGLLDFLSSPDAQMSLGLLAAAGPRSDGAGFGQRLQEGMGYAQAQQDNALKRKMAQMQMDEKQAQVQEQKRVRELMSSGAQVDYQELIRQGVPYEMVKQLADSRNLGRDKVARTAEVEGPNGSKLVQGYDDYGQPVGQGVNGYVAPQMVDLGDRKTFAKPMIGLSLPVGMSPSERDASSRGWAGVRQAGARLEFDKAGGVGGVNDGGTTQTGLNKMFGKPQAGYRWKADGSLEFIPGGPADQKALMQKGGEGTVGGVVADLRDKYTQLDSENGIVSTNNRFGTNMGAWAGATGIGQALNGMVGTKTQSARDSIAMTRPLLLQAIMKATGMSAKQMDSNAELKLYLATATDPQKGLEANKEALDRIEKLYGGGANANHAPRPAAKPLTNPGAWSIQKAD